MSPPPCPSKSLERLERDAPSGGRRHRLDTFLNDELVCYEKFEIINFPNPCTSLVEFSRARSNRKLEMSRSKCLSASETRRINP